MKNKYIRPEFSLVRFDTEDILSASSISPTITPTIAPTATPTIAPTITPTIAPTATPTATPAGLGSADHSAGAYSIKGMLGLW